jgi:hypothetical protein
MSGALFDYVTECISQLREDTSEEELAENADFDRFTDSLLRELEGFSGDKADKYLVMLRSLAPSVFDGMVEDAFLRDTLKRIPGKAQRVRQIMPIASKEPQPSGATQTFLREATRCYIFGFWHASVALSRAALEEGLWTAMKGKLPTKPEKLRDLLKSCIWLGELDSAGADLADEVVLDGNRVLHGKPASREAAWAVLCAVRGVLLHLYGLA